ncbi:MAG: reverse transcriptase N-terminal domain-containing protein [Cyanobacteria bacterium J06592_8]
MSKTSFKTTEEWCDINWRKLERVSYKLQTRIYRAKARGDEKAVRKLQKTLMRSWSARALSVRKVTQDNQGRKTAGVDGVKALTPNCRLMVGQNWAISELSKLAKVVVREGWQKDGNGTSQIRKYLGLEKDKKNKGEAKPETHAIDGVALACSMFVKYRPFQTANTHGHYWVGFVNVTHSDFKVITRFGAVKRGKQYGFFRRQLHFEIPDQTGTRKRKGGTITPFGFRIGDLAKGFKGNQEFLGYVGGFTPTAKSKSISLYSWDWKRIGQFSPKKVELIRR